MIKKILFTVAMVIATVSFVQAQQNINVQGNGISILDTDTTPDLADHTDFGQVAVGSSLTRTYTIENTGNADLHLNSLGKTLGTSGDFTVSTSGIATTITPGNSTTFTVTFNSSSIGVITGGIIIGSDSPAPEDSYTYSIQAEGIAAGGANINVQGNSVDIVDNDTTPDLADHTNFGQVAVGSSLTRTFTIQNTGTVDLHLNSLGKTLGSDNQFSINTSGIATTIAPGNSTTFTVVFTPTATGVATGGIIIGSDSPAPEDSYTFSIQAEGIAAGAADINVQGNGVDIVDGDNTPDLADHTDFGQVAIGSSLIRTFTIQNTGGSDLNITGASLGLGTDGQFSLDNSSISTPISSGNSTTFTVTFTSTTLGIVTGQVRITSDDPDSESTYVFDIRAEGINAGGGSPLLITQYYEGAGNNQWIEIKNISATATISGAYSLALFSNFQTVIGTIETANPNAFISIPGMASGEVRLFSNNSASLPAAGNRGNAIITSTGVCDFDGNDVILISTSTGANCYNDRIDIVGVVGDVSPPFWGQNISYIKGCGTTEVPSLSFGVINVPDIGITAADYIRLPIEEVDVVDDPNTNITLGTQVLGNTIWTGSWSNLKPDRTRDVIINGNYSAANGSLTTCNLNVTGTINLDGGTTNYVDVHKNLTITGSFTVGDTESLYFGINNESAVISGSITKKETTTQLADVHDFTYWSSPVSNASIGTVFSASDLTRVFTWDQSATNTIPGGGTEVLGEWVVASGTMELAKGYIAEGPTAGAYPTLETVSYTGAPNNGPILISGIPNMVFTNDGNVSNDYNLIGNPYPSAIDADVFTALTDNSNIDGSLWLWTHNTPLNPGLPIDERYNTDDYACFNTSGSIAAGSGGSAPTKNIGSGQGFMVRTIGGDGPDLIQSTGVIFNNAMRLKNENTQFFRAPDAKKLTTGDEKDRIWLDMETEGGAFNQILIGFFDKATDGFDRGYDGLRNTSGWVSFYSTIDTLGYGIQGLSKFNIDKKVNLGFNTYINEDVKYTISISKIEGALVENDVYLVDNLLNVTHDLKLAPYEFNLSEESVNPNRFTLQFVKSTLGVDDLADLTNDFVILNEDNALRIKSSTTVSKIQVFDTTGRLLVDKKPNQNEFSIDSKRIKKGTILILNATFENGAKISKKAIRY